MSRHALKSALKQTLITISHRAFIEPQYSYNRHRNTDIPTYTGVQTDSYTPLTRLLHASYALLTRLLHASAGPNGLLHASYTPLTRLLHASPTRLLHASAGPNGLLHASYTPPTRFLHACYTPLPVQTPSWQPPTYRALASTHAKKPAFEALNRHSYNRH